MALIPLNMKIVVLFKLSVLFGEQAGSFIFHAKYHYYYGRSQELVSFIIK